MVKLGGGSYGDVHRSGKFAVKRFSKLNHMVQEATAAFYLRGSECIVEGIDCNVHKKELRMALCDCNLSEWMDRFVDAPDHIRYSLMNDIITGLDRIHKLHLVHGDLKPGNILVKYDHEGVPHARIGDLGFVSLAQYAKVERTARAYRAENVVPEASHDLFSLGVILFELFSGYKLRKRLSHERLQKLAKEHIDISKVRRAVVALVDKHSDRRPTCRRLLNTFFKTDLDTISEWDGDPSDLATEDWEDLSSGTSSASTSDDTVVVSVEVAKRVRNVIKVAVNGTTNPLRAKKACKAVLSYIVRNDLQPEDIDIHVMSMIIILSSNFGPSGFNDHRAAKLCHRSKEDVLDVLQSLLDDEEVINTIMSP